MILKPTILPLQVYLNKKTLVAFDVSGSMPGGNYYEKLLQETELDSVLMNQSFCIFTTEIVHTGIIDKNLALALKQPIIGGTLCQCIYDHAKDQGFEHVIIFTDGYVQFNSDTHGISTTWMIVDNIDKTLDTGLKKIMETSLDDSHEVFALY